MKKRKRHKEIEIGKVFKTVRLKGKAMKGLRWECYVRANAHCEECGNSTPWERGEMAHIRTKRNHGDTLDNVRWLCNSFPNYCHAKEHNCGGKPCPPKPKVESC